MREVPVKVQIKVFDDSDNAGRRIFCKDVFLKRNVKAQDAITIAEGFVHTLQKPGEKTVVSV